MFTMTGPDHTMWTLLVLDFSHCPALEEMEALMKLGSTILHQDEHNAMIVFMPGQFRGLGISRQLFLIRRIEDRLLHYGLNIEHEISLHYTLDDAHAGDKRPLASRTHD